MPMKTGCDNEASQMRNQRCLLPALIRWQHRHGSGGRSRSSTFTFVTTTTTTGRHCDSRNLGKNTVGGVRRQWCLGIHLALLPCPAESRAHVVVGAKAISGGCMCWKLSRILYKHVKHVHEPKRRVRNWLASLY
jgi:hypothetical protein